MSHHTTKLDPTQIRIPEGSGWRKVPLIAGVIGVGCLGGAAAMGWGTKQFSFSYLVAFCYFLTFALGGLFFVIAQFAGRAGWSVIVRRLAEHAMATLPLFAVLFIPIALGAHDLYHWTHEDAVAQDALLQGKQPYLKLGGLFGFYGRAAIYFALWALLAAWFYKRSLSQDESKSHEETRRMQRAAGPAIAIFAFTVSFAAFDWLMSLEPHWYSTIFGIYYFAGCVIAIFGMIAVLSLLLTRSKLLTGVLTTEHTHDVGKFLFAFVVFWAYIGFSQYMLQWYGNIPEETMWYAQRGGGWLNTSVFLAVGHFLIPLFFLLPKGIKRARPTLMVAALWLLAMHYVDIYWLVMPTLHKHAPQISPLDALTFVGIGGLFVAVLARQLCRHALVPAGDPRLPESLTFENI